MNQRWRLIALWLLPLAVVAFLGWQLLGNGGTARFKPEGATVAPRNAAVARMSYGRFLDYVDAGRVTAVDIFDGGRSAVIEAVDPDLDNRVQRLRVDLPGVAPELVNKLKEQGDQLRYSSTQNRSTSAWLARQSALPIAADWLADLPVTPRQRHARRSRSGDAIRQDQSPLCYGS